MLSQAGLRSVAEGVALAEASESVLERQHPMRTTTTKTIWKVRVRVVKVKMKMMSQWLLMVYQESRK